MKKHYALLLIMVLAGCAPTSTPDTVHIGQRSSGSLPQVELHTDWRKDFAAIERVYTIQADLRAGISDEERAALVAELLLVLTSDASQTAKAEAQALLSRLADESAVPVLAGMLTDPSAGIHARAVLERIPGDAAMSALMGGLQSYDTGLATGCMESLSRRGEIEAIPALEMALSSGNTDIQAAACAALSRFENRAAAEALRNAEPVIKENVRKEWELAMMLTAPALDDQNAVDTYTTIGLASANPSVRSAALAGLARYSTPENKQLFESIIRDPEHPLRARAIALIAENPETAAAWNPTSWLNDIDDTGAALLAGALGQIGDPAAADALIQLLDRESEGVRIAAYYGLAQIAQPDALPQITAKASEETGAVREAARSAIAVMASLGVDQKISEALASEGIGEDLRIVYTQAAADRRIESAMPALLKMARGENRKIASESLSAISEIGTAADTPELLEILQNTDSKSTRMRVADAIVSSAKRGDTASAVQSISTTFESADTDIQEILLEALGQIGHPSSLDLLLTSAASTDDDIQKSALRAIGQWPNAVPATALLEIAESLPGGITQRLAIRGVLELASKEANEATRWDLYERSEPLATNPEERRKLISGVAELGGLAALDKTLAYIQEESVREEAAAALVQVSQALGEEHPDEVKAALKSAVQLIQTDAILQEMAKYSPPLAPDNHIIVWDFSGPFAIDEDAEAPALDQTFPPELGAGAWSMIRGGASPQRPWFVDLNLATGGQQENCVGYLRTWFRSQTDAHAVLEIGTTDGVKIWLNNEIVYMKDETRPIQPNSDQVLIKFNRGTNEMTIKLTQTTGEWGAAVRVAEVPEESLAGLMVKGDGMYMMDLPTAPHDGPLPEGYVFEPAEKWTGDPYFGDWQGKIRMNGQEWTVYAQVIPLGDDEFSLRLLPAFDTRDEPIGQFTGKLENGEIAFTAFHGTARAAGDTITGSLETRGDFELSKVERLSPTLGKQPPAGAKVLFDGTNFDAWYGEANDNVTWKLVDGNAAEVTPQTGGIITHEKFRDFDLHLEFRAPYSPGNEHQFNGNSGVFLQFAYEVQILASYGLPGLTNECGAFYELFPPDVNMCAPPLQWQTYDIDFRAARYDDSGNLIEPARATVVHNGVTIHDNRELPSTTIPDRPPPAEPASLYIQDHHNRVQFRNIWIVPRNDQKEVALP